MDSQFIGNVIYNNQGVAGNIPLAAAYSLVPVAIMAVYLWLARRTRRLRVALMAGRWGLRLFAVRPGVPLRADVHRLPLLVQRRPRAVLAHHELDDDWYSVAFGNPELRNALVLSLEVGLGATAIAADPRLARGAGGASLPLLRPRDALFALVLPIALPGIVTGIALSASINGLGIPFSPTRSSSATPRSVW